MTRCLQLLFICSLLCFTVGCAPVQAVGDFLFGGPPTSDVNGDGKVDDGDYQPGILNTLKLGGTWGLGISLLGGLWQNGRARNWKGVAIAGARGVDIILTRIKETSKLDDKDPRKLALLNALHEQLKTVLKDQQEREGVRKFTNKVALPKARKPAA